MVRLKVLKMPNGVTVMENFNSKMVRLIAYRYAVTPYAGTHFNSKMVRLKEQAY